MKVFQPFFVRAYSLLTAMVLIFSGPCHSGALVSPADPYQGTHLKNVLLDLQKHYNVEIVFEDRLVASKTVPSGSVNFRKSLETNLYHILSFNGLHFRKIRKDTYVITERPSLGKDLNQRDLSGGRPEALTRMQAHPLERLVSGIVRDEAGNGLPGVSILIKGTQKGTATDAHGRFSLALQEGEEILVFSYVGYVSREVPVDSRTMLDVVLLQDNKALEEIVVVGYGTVRKSDLTGSVAQVKAREINAFPATNVLQALNGRAPGVQVLQNTGAPGAAVSVRIRGTNSIQGSNEPLYVIDGFPISESNPTVLNNSDIESIEILKDASATAIYGSRGANGVVLITTKSGKAGKTTVDFETSYSIQSLRKKLDLMNAKEYALFYNEQAKNDNLAPHFSQQEIDGFGEGFDWQDLVFQKAPMKTSAVNISGGNEKTQFSVSGSILDQDGIIKGSDYARYALRTNIRHALSPKLNVTFSSTLTRVDRHDRNSQGGNRGGSMISAAISAPPTITPYNADGSYRNLAIVYPFISNVLRNPLNWINEQTSRTLANRVLANASLSYQPVKELTFRVFGGIENADMRGDSYTTNLFINSQGSASVSASQSTSLLNENTVQYTKSWNRHNLSALGGATYQEFLNTSLGGSGTGFLSNVSETYDLVAAATAGIPASGYSKSTIVSFLGRVNYTFDERYLVTLSLRRDGASKYSTHNKWGNFPSGALAWRVSNEKFLRDKFPFLNELKMRVSWGLTGSQAIGAYATLNQLISGKTVFNDDLFTTYAPGTRLPGDLKWETTEQKDAGVDIGLFGNRLFISMDYYVKTTRDLLNTVELPPSFGFTTTIRNVGSIRNTGFEWGVDAKVLNSKVKWNLNGNLSLNRNKVLKLNDGKDILGGYFDISAVTDYRNILREGQPIGRFWGYVEEGYTETGKIKYKDTDGDGTLSINDKTYIGNPNPDFIYGLNSSLEYQNFEWSFFIQGIQGNDIFNTSAINNTVDYGYGLNMPRYVFANRWTPANPDARYPVISSTTRTNVSDRFVEDGSYMRLKNIQLTYKLPVSSLGVSWMKYLHVYASGQNLITLTGYSWWDPEVNSEGGANSVNQGFDQYSYPTAKSYTFGVRIGF